MYVVDSLELAVEAAPAAGPGVGAGAACDGSDPGDRVGVEALGDCARTGAARSIANVADIGRR
jgi:hypothetical protein